MAVDASAEPAALPWGAQECVGGIHVGCSGGCAPSGRPLPHRGMMEVWMGQSDDSVQEDEKEEELNAGAGHVTICLRTPAGPLFVGETRSLSLPHLAL